MPKDHLTPEHHAAARTLAAWLAGQAGSGPYKAATSGGEDYDNIRADLVDKLKDAFLSFVSTNGKAARNKAKRTLVEDIPAAFYRGYEDGGGDTTEPDDEAWLTAKQAEQLGFMGDALDALRATGEDITESAIDSRVEFWAGTLDGIYSEGKLRGSKNMMCYFDGDDGAESCDTCQGLKDGPPRSVKYILAHDLIPRPGNKNFDCGGWQCQHGWRSVKTNEWMTL